MPPRCVTFEGLGVECRQKACRLRAHHPCKVQFRKVQQRRGPLRGIRIGRGEKLHHQRLTGGKEILSPMFHQ